MSHTEFFEPPGRATLLNATSLKRLYLSYLSKPASDRVLYRAIGRRRMRKILEIGIGTGGRAVRMIELAGRVNPGEPVRYAAIDGFEARGPQAVPGLTLKDAHRLLKSTSAQVQLIPGDPATALARWANSLTNVDLVVISADFDDGALAGAWFYFPRMLHERSVVYRETRVAGSASVALGLVPPEVIAERAEAGRRRRAA